jgi:cytochrome c oxidase subunit 1
MASISNALRRPTSTTGVWGWITTVDHKKIGIMYGISAFSFFLIGGLEAFIIRLQLARPEHALVSPEIYSQLFTMHALTMIFLGVMPLSAAFFNLVIPLMIGARDVAFPRLNALSLWVFILGALMFQSGWVFGGAPNAGWFAYAPLTSSTFSPGHGMDYYVLGLGILGVSSVAAALNFIVTIINMRAPGMTLMKMPVFVWMTLVTSVLLVTAFPVITVGLIELFLDRTFGFHFFNPAAGADPVLWQHLFWVFGHPEVYILILPAMGIVTEVLPTFSKKPLFGYPVIVLSGISIGFMGWAVWSHHMFTVGLGPIANSVFALTTMTIAVPTGVKIFNWIATMWGGNIELKTPMLYSIGFIFLFIIGGLSGVMHAIAPSDAQQQDTYFIVAHVHYVLFGGSMFAIMSGIHYWFPKASGRMLSESIGKVSFWLMFIGMNVTFFPMHFLGMDGMPRRQYTYDSSYGWDFWNLVATIGVFFLAAGIIAFVHNFFRSIRKGEVAGNDPWDARTLEWSMASPPPEYNFAVIPTVSSRDAFWEQKQTGTTIKENEGGTAYGEEGNHGIHMPSPSYWPLVVAIGLTISGNGLMYSFPAAGFGVFLTMVGIYAWSMEPATAPDNH